MNNTGWLGKLLKRVRRANTQISKTMSRRTLRKFLNQELARIPSGSRVLSVGAGGEIGAMAKQAAQQHRYEVFETDVDPKRAPDIIADICEDEFRDTFDVILVIEVLEHVVQPGKAVETLWRALKPGGCLIGSTPFLFPLHGEPNDHFRYTRHQLQRLLSIFDTYEVREKAGFFETLCVIMSRAAFADNDNLCRVSLPINGFVFLLWPIACMLDKAFPTRFCPLGYMFLASKG